jgi:hypothetical protein
VCVCVCTRDGRCPVKYTWMSRKTESEEGSKEREARLSCLHRYVPTSLPEIEPQLLVLVLLPGVTQRGKNPRSTTLRVGKKERGAWWGCGRA